MTEPKPITPKQLAANRRNAARSTGPRTDGGRARSRWNALKHGILAQELIPESLERVESRADFDALLARLIDDFAPQTAVEETLVERIATLYWRLGRLYRAEAGAIAGLRFSVQERRLSQHKVDDEEARLIVTQLLGRPWKVSFRHDVDSLAERLTFLATALEQGDAASLRPFVAAISKDRKWTDPDAKPDESVLQKAADSLPAVAQSLRDGELRRAAAQAAAADVERLALPDPETVATYARYEAVLDRQLYRALNMLERLQRRRQGDSVPPPVEGALEVTIDT